MRDGDKYIPLTNKDIESWDYPEWAANSRKYLALLEEQAKRANKLAATIIACGLTHAGICAVLAQYMGETEFEVDEI